MLQRLFAATESPDLYPLLKSEIVSLEKDGIWKIPIGIANNSSAVGEHVTVNVEIENPSDCEKIELKEFRDVSDINPGKKIFMFEFRSVIHRAMNMIPGTLLIAMKGRKHILKLIINIFANKMRARKWKMSIQLAKGEFSVTKTEENYIY